ncbi:GSCOCG00013316001-RA-CDS [Cotesia congregata]|uniref:Similar to Ankrd16: Ankyrin repeat domain-containing protein 16 (Rattus norvegicus) n=1 Tax=Cotesia congregata TaxID=51543 RepID=A0A8J2HKB6_COTCN|nr:GSCOCG00013316001-RA-CDS [Cotesia congregata]CAG5093981.1 Similar to Ankrd16: Ankyrin repeat domain-containing protein 16 (Rattus norvegicus) [Cotesia congregata]
MIDALISKEFLHLTQKGELQKLKNFVEEHKITDWTVFRHEVSGDTALHVSAREGNLEIVQFLCNGFLKPEFKTDVANKDMKRPLHEAAQFARPKIIEFLLSQGATVDALKRADWTPLMLGCAKNTPEAFNSAEILIKNGANLELRNKDGWNCLHIACRSGNIDIIQLILSKIKPLVDSCSKNGRTALHIAAFHGFSEAVEILAATSKDLLNKPDYSGLLPLHESVKNKNFEVFNRLLQLGCDINSKDSIGQTALHIAASIGNIPVIEHILQNNLIDIDRQDGFQTTPLTAAERNKMEDAVNCLKKYMKQCND